MWRTLGAAIVACTTPIPAEPGFKMLPIADVVWRTRCVSLEDCLGAIREWSDAPPGTYPWW